MNILFVCTHNRCRSILCEAITNYLANGKIKAASAGSQAEGKVHPLTLKFLQERNIPVAELRSKSWNDESLTPDIVITVCDNAANESCPVWLNKTIKTHWGLPDPSKTQGAEEEVRHSFFAVMEIIETRIKKLLELPLETMTGDELQLKLNAIAGEQ